MANVYSTRFLEKRGLDSTPIQYTCPAGKVAVIRCVTMYTSVVLRSQCFLEGNLGQTLVAGLTGFNTTATFGQEFHYVFYEGETITMRTSGENWDVSCSGYLLTLP